MRSRSSDTYTRRFSRIRPLGSPARPSGRKQTAAKSVLLTRPEAETRTLKAGLKARGRGLLAQRLLTTAPLAAQVPSPQDYQAVIASSAVAVEILSRQSPDRTCPLFVVGKASVKAAELAGFQNIKRAATASDLAALIRGGLMPTAGPLLYVAGRHRARDMRRLLSGFELDLIEVYAAEKSRVLSPIVRRALRRGHIGQIAFYSARAADAFMAAAARGKVAKHARKTTALCLSPRIAARLQAHGWRRTWAARIPAADLIEARIFNNCAPLKPIADSSKKSPVAVSNSSPAAIAVPEASMTSPAPTSPVESASTPPADGRSPPGWPAVIAVAVLAVIFAAVAWYLSKDRVEGLQAEVAGLRDRVGALNLDPGKADRAAMAARTEEAAKVSTALAAVAEKAADKASVDSLSTRLDTLGGKMEVAVTALEQKTSSALADADAAAKTAVEQSAALAKSVEARGIELAQTLEEQASAHTEIVETLTQKIASLEARFAKVEAWTKGASPAQLAERLVALSELRRLVDIGAPFAAGLSRAAKSLPDVADANGGWLNRANSGIPTYPQMLASLNKIEKKLPPPKSNASGNTVINSALGVLFSGIQVEGKGALVDDPDREAVAAARKALSDGDPAAAHEAIAALADKVQAVAAWQADLAARMEAEKAISAWETKVLATVGESVQ